jgi:SAM-dependent methyltransferase
MVSRGTPRVNEEERLRAIDQWYLTEQLDLDRRMVAYRHRAVRPWLKPPTGLELGPAEGVMTRLLLEDFEILTVVDASVNLLAQIPDDPRLTKECSLFERYTPSRRFDTVVLDHVLEHVESPDTLLLLARSWAVPKGRLIIGVPNAHSIHRLVAVKMGLLGASTDLNERDRAVGHRRVYTPTTLREAAERAELAVIHEGGVFLKPISNQQIDGTWTDAMLEGFFHVGFDFPHLAAEIFVVCQVQD